MVWYGMFFLYFATAFHCANIMHFVTHLKVENDIFITLSFIFRSMLSRPRYWI